MNLESPVTLPRAQERPELHGVVHRVRLRISDHHQPNLFFLFGDSRAMVVANRCSFQRSSELGGRRRRRWLELRRC
jgi:hypothetical protein